jgi:hypothetical protein
MENGRTERKIEFIVATLADLAVNDQKHDQRLSRLERGLSRLERVAKLMVKAGLRERKNRSEADARLSAALTDLAEAQKASIAHTDSKVDTLFDMMRKHMNGV